MAINLEARMKIKSFGIEGKAALDYDK